MLEPAGRRVRTGVAVLVRNAQRLVEPHAHPKLPHAARGPAHTRARTLDQSEGTALVQGSSPCVRTVHVRSRRRVARIVLGHEHRVRAQRARVADQVAKEALKRGEEARAQCHVEPLEH